MNIEWKTWFDEASKCWIADCPSLGLTASADSYSELTDTINETVDAVFKDLLASGDFERFMENKKAVSNRLYSSSQDCCLWLGAYKGSESWLLSL